MDYQEYIKAHYLTNWQNDPDICYWGKGPANDLPFDFRILVFAPTNNRKMWTYATCCMSQQRDEIGIELHLFSSKKDDSLIELLTVVAHYHRTGHFLDLGHTVNFGKPWQDDSDCNYGLISLPYLDGPNLENMVYKDKIIKFYWLVPITFTEMTFKKLHGIEALEEKLEEKSFNYLDSKRLSVV